MTDPIERHLASIDKTLKRIAKKIADEGVDVSFADPKRLTEPDAREVLRDSGVLGNERLGRGVHAVKRLTEPGDPPTGGEGDYLLNPDEAGDKRRSRQGEGWD